MAAEEPTLRTCETCVGWKQPFNWDGPYNPRATRQQNSNVEGECHMNPPQVGGHNTTVWPKTRYKDWCMQWAEDRDRVVERLKRHLVTGE